MAEEAAQAATTTQAAAQAAAATTTQTQTEGDLASLPEWARKQITALNSEDAANRVKAKDRDALAAKLKALEDAQLSEQQKLEQRAKDLEKQADDRAAELRQERANRAVEREARRLKIVDEETALALISGKIEYGADGQPTNITALLTELVKAKPFLVGTDAPSSGGNPGNPAGGRGSTLTLEAIKAMTPEQINARYDEIREFMKNNK